MKTIHRINSLVTCYWKQVALSALVLLGLTAIDMVFPSIIRQVIDIGLEGNQSTFMLQGALMLLGMGAMRAVLGYNNRYLTEWIAHHVAYDLRNRMYNHIQRLPFTYHDHAQSGQLISRTIEDVRSIQGFAGNGLVELLRVILLLVGIIIIIFTANPKLAVIALLPMIPLIAITTSFGRRMRTLFLHVDNTLGELSSRLQENVTGVQVVRAFAREQYEVDRFNQENKVLYKAQLKVVGEWSKIMPTTTFLVTLGTILLLWFGGQMVLANELTIGELVAFNAYMLLLAQPSQQIGNLVNSGSEAAAGLQRTFEVLETVPEIQSPPKAVTLSEMQGKVEFRSVSFKYTGENTTTLHEINLTVKPNQVIALIGPTGSGKTTLVNLIPRFYDTCSGSVLVDDVDVRQLDLLALRRQIGIVLQTSLLFSASIRENLAYGRPDASMEDIIAAAKAAQAHEFITQLPNGYDTVVGERGITLSGGQRQRVAIGRALLMNPRILILDDSTSSVDTQTEHALQQALTALMSGRTTFVIAQRLTSVRRADLIVVMDDGRIVERGTHHQLLAQDGLYRQIYDLQLRDQEQFQDAQEQPEPVPVIADQRQDETMDEAGDSNGPN